MTIDASNSARTPDEPQECPASPTLTRRELRLAREGSRAVFTADERIAREGSRVITSSDIPRAMSIDAAGVTAAQSADDEDARSSSGDSAASADAPASDDAEPAETTRERGLFHFLINAIVISVLTVLLAIAAAAIVVPAVTGSTALTVMTSSMEPTLPPGTMVVVRPTAPEDIREGMVLTYQLRSGEPALVTHRVVDRVQQADGTYLWTTQGDNNPAPDVDAVREVQVRGTVWYAIPYLGWASTALTGDWRAWAIPIAVVALFGYALVMVIGALRERARRRAAS